MGKITVYENGRRRGSTSYAYGVVTKKELMREHTLEFSILNNNPIYKEITTTSVFENKGQMFDITGIDTESGDENTTAFSAEHVSYRMNNYTVPANYAFTGTIKEIAQDILNVSGAAAEFSIGECLDDGFASLNLNNDKEITARAAMFGMTNLGVEIDYDNFIINIPKVIGNDTGKVFRFGVDLKKFRRRWQVDNGWTYDVTIADVQKTDGNEKIEFSIGDTVTAEDSFIGDVIKKRIISYIENDDDPTQNSITLGVFIQDTETQSAETDRVANSALNSAASANETADAAKEKADNSVQQGEKYSNVSITHKDGFMAVNKSGTQRVMMNADDCFVVQALQNGKWVTVNSLELFGLLVDRLTSLEAKDKFYIKVGKTDSDKYGLLFYIDDQKGFEVSSSDADTIALKSPKAIYLESGDLFKLEATDTICLKALANDAISYIEARNLALYTDNLISKNSTKGLFGRGISGSCKLETTIDGTSTTGDFEIINGIITKFPGLQFTW